MKKLLAVVVLAALGYLGYTKWSEWQNNKAMAEAAERSKEAALKEAAAQPQKHLAPAGTYYLLQRVSATTESGVVGVPPGTKVTVISATPTGMHVTNGANQFDVDSSQVTNDLDIAGQLPGFVQAVATTSVPAIPAPNSTYYLLQTISVTTDSGVSGIAPGTKVTVISATADGMHVTDGTNQFDVTASQVTGDLTVATQALKADSAAQAQLDQYKAQQAAALHEERLQQQAAAVEAAAHATPTPVYVAPQGTSLDRGTYK